MSIAVASFDTLKFVRRLRDAGVEEKQAEAFSEAIREVQDAQLKELATKGDLKELETKLTGSMRELEIRMDRRMDLLTFDLKLIKWMLALVIASTVLPALKHLFGG